MNENRPNILLLLSDQHRHDALGCSGNTVVRTPGMDSLAEEGMRFTSAFTPTSLCSPARASLLTGLYAHNHGLLANMGAWWVSGLYPKLVVEAGPPEMQGRLIAITEFFWAVGILAGTLISGALASVFLRLPFMVCVLVLIPMFLLAMLVARGYHRAPDNESAASG